MDTNEITLEMLNKEYYKTGVEEFPKYVEMVSIFILNKEIPFEISNDEHHDLVSLGNEYIFQNQNIRESLLNKIRNIPYEKLNEALEDYGLSIQERKMIFCCIYETAFLGCVTHGEAPMYLVLRFPVIPIVLHWDRGLFYTTKM